MSCWRDVATDISGTYQDPAVYVSLAFGGWGSGLFGTLGAASEAVFWRAVVGCIANPICRLITGMAGGAGTTNRAVELHDALKSYPDPQPFQMRTTAVLTTQEGPTLVASSQAYIDPVQRAMLATNEVEVMGQASVHAEEKLIIAAITDGLTPNTMYVSRISCPTCQALMDFFNIPSITP